MPLELVPKREPDPAEAVRTRIKKMDRPDGMLQCPKCGSRSAAQVETGIVITNGKRKRGTVNEKDICAHCLEFRQLRIQMRTGDERPEVVK